jgi:hypothetical protein
MGDLVRCCDCIHEQKDPHESIFIICPANHDELRNRHILRPCKLFAPKEVKT